MTTPGPKPLLTFALVSYNQEPFVREAVQAAFAQTYSPLQIILSDDCSDDRSFEIMRELAAQYRGPHEVVLNRNPVRKIMGGHLNRVMELTRGELFVIAAADDVSLPNRTQVVFEAWEASGRKATSLYSDLIQINDRSEEIKRLFTFEDEVAPGQERFVEVPTNVSTYLQTLKPTVHGCSHAFCPKLYRQFGGLPDAVVYEDKVIAFRSVVVGKVVYITEPLVKYRLHGANLFKYLSGDKVRMDLESLAQHEVEQQKVFRNSEIMYAAFLQDLRTASQEGLLDPARSEALQQEAESQRARFSLMSRFLVGGLITKCRLLSSGRRLGLSRADLRLLRGRLLPKWLYLRIRLAKSRMGRSARKVSPTPNGGTVPDSPDVA